MFYTEEDVQPVVDVAVSLFGPVGNMIEGDNVFCNVSIATREFGKVWYGDIESSKEDLQMKCQELSNRFSQKVYMFDVVNNYEFTDNNLISSPLTN